MIFYQRGYKNISDLDSLEYYHKICNSFNLFIPFSNNLYFTIFVVN